MSRKGSRLVILMASFVLFIAFQASTASAYSGLHQGQQLYISADTDDWPEADNFVLLREEDRIHRYVDHLASRGNTCEIYFQDQDRYSRSTIDITFLVPGVDELDTDGVTLRSYSEDTKISKNQDTFRHSAGFEFEEQDHRSAERDYNAYGLFNAMSDDFHKTGTGLDGQDLDSWTRLRPDGENTLYGDLICANPEETRDHRSKWNVCARDDAPYSITSEEGTEWDCTESGQWFKQGDYAYHGLGSIHRGGLAQAPENTLQAFENTRLIGLQSAEFDVHITQDEEFVVHHDSTIERRLHSQPGSPDTHIRNLDADEIIGVQARAEYIEGFSDDPDISNYEGWDYTVSQELVEGEEGHEKGADYNYAYIPGLGETLDYFNKHNMVPRIDLKGPVREDPEKAEQVYEMVKNRGMVDSSIFFQLPSDCGKTWFGLGSFECEWKGLEAIESVSEGEAVTAASYRGDIDYMYDALDEADDAGMDILDTNADFDSWCAASRFAEEVHEKGLGHAGIAADTGEDSPVQKEREMLFNGVYASADTPEWLKDRIDNVNNQESSELDLPSCLPSQKHNTSAEIAQDLKSSAGEFNSVSENESLPYLTGNVSYNIHQTTWRPNPAEIVTFEDRHGAESSWEIFSR